MWRRLNPCAFVSRILFFILNTFSVKIYSDQERIFGVFVKFRSNFLFDFAFSIKGRQLLVFLCLLCFKNNFFKVFYMNEG